MGQSEQALQMLEPLGKTHPGDSATWLDIGLCYFSMGRYVDAIEPFNHMLEIDPDNEVGHFELMQCYRKLRRITDARREEAIYRALHTDSPPALVQRYLSAHPDAAREAQPIHEHLLSKTQ
jgi:predicted Zn-dependent protease